MKKTTLFLFTIFLLGVNAFSQTIVSTSSQNKKVILEEFTGVNCVYCPQGHAIANDIKNANPSNAFLINIHVGGYATPSAGQPDFRTTFGTGIAGQSGLVGYPAGTINRSVFTGLSQNGAVGTAMSRNNWTNAANQILAQNSYVNVATSASINVNTRVLTVLVEAYYTGASPVSTNKLNVAFLQNNTTGPQTGGNMGNDYNHQHRLIHMLTGQWGETITTTTAGSFVSRNYTYTIPESYNLISAEMGDFEIVAFMAEGQQKIISGNGATPTYTNLLSSDALVKEVLSIDSQCSTSIQPKIKIQNYGQSTLTTLPITYSINGQTPQVYNWTGSLNTFAKETVTLPSTSYTLMANNTLNVSIPSDGNNTNNSGLTSFLKAGETFSTNITIKVTLDQYGSETSWNLKNSSNVIVATNPTYVDASGAGEYPQPDVNLTLPYDCYTFTISDAYGDGMNSGYGLGSYEIQGGGVLISGAQGGTFGGSEAKPFSVVNQLGISEFETEKITVFPNPSNDIFTFSSISNFDLIVTDIFGKVVLNQKNMTNNNSINLSSFQKGVYLAKVITEETEKTVKLILN